MVVELSMNLVNLTSIILNQLLFLVQKEKVQNVLWIFQCLKFSFRPVTSYQLFLSLSEETRLQDYRFHPDGAKQLCPQEIPDHPFLIQHSSGM